MKNYIRTANDRLVATIILIAVTVVAVGSALGIAALREYNIYEDGGEYAWSVGRNLVTETNVNNIVEEYYSYLVACGYNAGEDSLPVVGNLGYSGNKNIRISENVISRYEKGKCNFAFKVKDMAGTVLWYNFDPADIPNAKATSDNAEITGTAVYQYTPIYGHTYYIKGNEISIAEDGTPINMQSDIQEVNITVEIYVLSRGENGRWSARDSYSMIDWWIRLANNLRFAIFGLVALSLIMIFSVLVMIMNSAGISPESENGKITPGFIDRIPLDLASLVCIGICAAAGVCMRLTYIAESGMVMENVVVIIASVVIITVIANLLETISVRIKLGRPGRNTLFYHLLMKFLRKTPKNVRKKVRRVSYTTKLIVFVVLVSIMILAYLAYFAYRYFILGPSQMGFEYFIIISIISMLIVVPLAIMFVMNFGYIRDAGQKIASGDLESADISSQISIKAMRVHGENLDHIKRDMARAVEQEMKDERFRNELISNISHDIRTPLTSIKSFVELLSAEDVTPEQRKEYMEVLQRQVSRLSGLTKDLMDISKFSTGNVSVNLEEMDIGVMVEQIVGEHYFRLQQNGIEIEIEKEDKEYPVMADGELLGRIITNLMTNIEKYAMASTRVFVRVSDDADMVKIMFRNISRDIPKLSGEELSERLVRGDSSRHTEGSGLGLSIAKSLTVLQHGTFDITVDGDIFTATIGFNRLSPEHTTQIFS